MQYQDFIKRLQKAMNDRGENLTVDGDPGPKTRLALEKFDVALSLSAAPVPEVKPILIDGEHFGAPWVFANLDLLGREESDKELNARYVPEWAKEGLPGYKTLAGNDHAWCSVRENADKRKVGVSTTNSAAASSWSGYGRSCPFWFGASLPIKHKSGGRHIADFLYWVDEAKKIAAVLGGNQGNKFSIVALNLSGSGDVLIPGPRWPKEMPDGQLIAMNDVLAKYPILKVGAVAGSTQ